MVGDDGGGGGGGGVVVVVLVNDVKLLHNVRRVRQCAHRRLGPTTTH